MLLSHGILPNAAIPCVAIFVAISLPTYCSMLTLFAVVLRLLQFLGLLGEGQVLQF